MDLLKTTTSVCSRCLTRVPAKVVRRDGSIILQKRCPEHGEEEAVVSSDERLYWLAGSGDGCGAGCLFNHSCTLIFEITERCNLTCPTCFAASSPHLTWQMPVSEFTAKLDRLLAHGKRDADMVQLSGGEPTLHPELERIVEICLERGVRKVYINTNGLRIAKEPALAHRLAGIDGGRDRVQLYLQFDGFEQRTYATIRGAHGLLQAKQRAIRNAIDAGLFVLPVMTVTRDVNLHEIGAVVRLMLEHHPALNTVMLQPAFYSGRHENGRPDDRLTMSEVAHAVERQTNGLFLVEDFGPVPCSHPNCFALAVGLMQHDRVIPISRYFPRYETWRQAGVAEFVGRFRDRLPQHMLDIAGDDELLDSLLDLLLQDDETVNWADYRNFVVIAIKPFMDAHTYDQDRVDRCCVHIVDRAGEPVSFCEYNAVRRPQGLL
jgi:tetraether lipid synthase